MELFYFLDDTAMNPNDPIRRRIRRIELARDISLPV
jgi:hypothetical protein